jgi:uncharacterized protein YndB with AHSA1/START domain
METNTNQVIQISKEFPVSVDELYNAWISPDALKEWWKPMGHQLKDITNELKEGGRIKYVFQDNNGDTVLNIDGNYSEVAERERLEYSWNWQFPKDPVGNSEFMLTIIFSAQGNGSKLDVRQENLKDEEAIRIHKEGWDGALNDLHDYLSR